MPGIVYFIQPAELVGTNRYKVGCSQSATLDRVRKGYKVGTRYLYIGEVDNALQLEKIIKKAFRAKFHLVAGAEYFSGNECEMWNEFVDIVRVETRQPEPMSDQSEDIPATEPTFWQRVGRWFTWSSE